MSGFPNTQAAINAAIAAEQARANAAYVALPVASWAPTGSIENGSRFSTMSSGLNPLNSGRLTLVGGIIIPAGRKITTITFTSTAAAVNPTHQWFCLVDTAQNVLAKTADDTTTAWSATADKTLTLVAYTPTIDKAVWVGIVVVADTTPTLVGWTGQSVPTTTAPYSCGFADGGLTTPASLGGSTNLAGGQTTIPWCRVA